MIHFTVMSAVSIGRVTFHFKQIVVLSYLKRYGAIVTDASRTWCYKHLSINSIVLVASETGAGKVEYDLDHMRLVARSSMIKGVIAALAAVPAKVVAVRVTFGVGLLVIPLGLFYAHIAILKIKNAGAQQTS
ncbi:MULTISPECIES: hypothetical protein [unclassified Pseudomonas]|uniref:hypothetical protein n=1 Tax=unclassified Pseudomonas TaxID=196821 RepID=UPI001F3C8D2C|nr:MULTISPECIES: hypothetical protein [unclassified Pseudomonas]